MKPFFNADQLRISDTKKIHIAKRDLGLDDATYRALLLRVTGKASSKECTPRDRQLLLEEFKRLGFKVKAKQAGRGLPNVAPDRMPRLRKIEALLADAGRPWAYLDPMLVNLGRSKIEFCDCDDLSKIIAMLMQDAKRRGRKTQ